MAKVLVVDDEQAQLAILDRFLTKHGWQVLRAAGGTAAVRLAATERPDAVIMDVRMPDLDGHAAYRRMHEQDPALPVILITAFGDIRHAVEAMKEGVVDYLTKPVDLGELLGVLEEATGHGTPRNDHSPIPDLPHGIVAESLLFRQAISEIALVAPTDVTCLLTGESGAGKEVLAKLIHLWSDRAEGPLACVNMAAVPSGLAEAELFGHVKGAFTGAVGDRIGRIEAATGGTLFLDEIGDLPPELQAHLLRALETKSFHPVGAVEERHSDFRLVVATNRDLEEAMRDGSFRQDLYYRINVFRTNVPPLRERPDDIVPLARSFLRRRDDRTARFSPRALGALTTYHWPGNVRELRNVVERASILARGDVILPEHLPDRIRSPVPSHDQPLLLRPLEETQKLAILEALRTCRGNRTHAAKLLGISRRTLLNRLKVYGIGRDYGRERQ